MPEFDVKVNVVISMKDPTDKIKLGLVSADGVNEMVMITDGNSCSEESDNFDGCSVELGIPTSVCNVSVH